jgi:hypothetical protein
VQLSGEAERKLADDRMKEWSKDQEEYADRQFQEVEKRKQEQTEPRTKVAVDPGPKKPLPKVYPISDLIACLEDIAAGQRRSEEQLGRERKEALEVMKKQTEQEARAAAEKEREQKERNRRIMIEQVQKIPVELAKWKAELVELGKPVTSRREKDLRDLYDHEEKKLKENQEKLARVGSRNYPNLEADCRRGSNFLKMIEEQIQLARKEKEKEQTKRRQNLETVIQSEEERLRELQETLRRSGDLP